MIGDPQWGDSSSERGGEFDVTRLALLTSNDLGDRCLILLSHGTGCASIQQSGPV